MDLLLWILFALLFNSAAGLSGAIILLAQNEKVIKFLSFLLVAFAAGALIGGGFLHLMPEALEELDTSLVLEIALLGFVLFLILEIVLHWHSCKECKMHSFSYLVLIGDALHNIIDGIIIASAFFVSIPVGIVTTIAIIMHEVPQELGIFGVQIYGGIKKTIALRNALIAQLTCVLGGLAAYFYISQVQELSFYILPFAAGGFVYVAASDLIPELHKEDNWKKILGLAVFFIGLIFMYVLRFMEF